MWRSKYYWIQLFKNKVKLKEMYDLDKDTVKKIKQTLLFNINQCRLQK